VTDFYRPPQEEVSFGDIFEADFFHDVFLKADAVQMGTRDMTAKYGGGLMYAESFNRNRDFVLGRGRPYRAMLIADNCLVDRILDQDNRGRRPQGRLLFAPIIETDAHKELKDFGRFALPEWEGRLPCSVAELRRCFMVDAPDIVAHRDQRIAALASDSMAELEVRWNAYAARRGPLAGARNAEKAAELVAHSNDDDPDPELAQEIAATLLAAWRLEGDALEAVSDAHADQEGGEDALATLQLRLEDLGKRASAAAERLAQANGGRAEEDQT
jgi:hypothetical protein